MRSCISVSVHGPLTVSCRSMIPVLCRSHLVPIRAVRLAARAFVSSCRRPLGHNVPMLGSAYLPLRRKGAAVVIKSVSRRRGITMSVIAVMRPAVPEMPVVEIYMSASGHGIMIMRIINRRITHAPPITVRIQKIADAVKQAVPDQPSVEKIRQQPPVGIIRLKTDAVSTRSLNNQIDSVIGFQNGGSVPVPLPAG